MAFAIENDGADVPEIAIAVESPASPGHGGHRRLPGRAGEAAVVVIDIQRSFADPTELAQIGVTDPADLDRVSGAIAACQELVTGAREAGANVVWVQLEQRSDAPWQASHWLRDHAPDAPGPCMAGTAGAEWFGITPGEGEPVISKRRYSGFVGTDLEAVLRSLGVTWVVPCGLTTECCVESTARDAFQLGFPVVMAQEASASYHADAHDDSLRSLAVNFAVITRLRSLLDAWATRPDAAARPIT